MDLDETLIDQKKIAVAQRSNERSLCTDHHNEKAISKMKK